MNSKGDFFIWIILIGFVFVIIGLYMSEQTPLNINEKNKILKINDVIVENFSSDSSSKEVEQGASPKYNWGLPDNYNSNDDDSESDEDCDDNYNKDSPKYSLFNTSNKKKCKPKPNYDDSLCKDCDITLNKDIDKYILKSSVPPCPDMTGYATKNMITSCPDISNYILKSEIPPCKKVDMSKYVLKSEIPASPECPICPQCPICPKCPDQVKEKCKELYEYKISEHPDMSKYILKSDILNSNEVKDYISKNYINKDKCLKKSDISKKVETKTNQQVNNNPVNNNPINTNKVNFVQSENNEKNVGYNYNIPTKNTTPKLVHNSDIFGMYAGDNLYAAF
jgi:hypothetical protein